MSNLKKTYFIDLLNEFNMYSEPGDYWGSVMSALFDVCAFLYQNEVSIPSDWEYRVSNSGDPQVETHDYIEHYPLEDVLNFGHFLYYMKCMLKDLGEDY